MKQREETSTLHTLKVISEVLNQTNDIQAMCDTVLKELIQVTQLSTGWIFLVNEKPHYSFVSSYQLPSILAENNNHLMCSGSCWCIDTYWANKLDRAVNIMECARIEDALKLGRKDCDGVTHHATIPIIAGDENLGILNVAAPNKKRFNKKELDLLQSVAYQIGTGIKRALLYQKEQKRAQYYQFLGRIQARIEQLKQLDFSFNELLKLFFLAAIEELNWHSVLEVNLLDGDVVTEYIYSAQDDGSQTLSSTLIEELKQHLIDKRDVFTLGAEGIELKGMAVKNPWQDNVYFIVLCSANFAFDELDDELLQHSLSYLNLLQTSIQLKEQQFEIAKQEERHRLARDLHDSVCQMLFSLSLTTKGLEAGLKHEIGLKDHVNYLATLTEIQKLATEAQREMRALIWQLRPFGLEQGLLSSLHSYAQKQGIQLYIEKEGIQNLPNRIEEHLWRIGQEAINNIIKHAKTDQACVALKVQEERLFFSIKDSGQGFIQKQVCPKEGGEHLGLQGIRERIALLGGSVRIKSKPGQGTEIEVQVPLSTNRRLGE